MVGFERGERGAIRMSPVYDRAQEGEPCREEVLTGREELNC